MMNKKEGDYNFISQLGNSPIDSDVSNNNVDSESNSQTQKKFSHVDLLFLNDDADSNDFCKEIDNIEISDIEDKLESKQRMRKVCNKMPFEQPPHKTNCYHVYPNQHHLRFANPISASSLNSQQSQFSNQQNFRASNHIPSSSTSSHYNSVQSNSSFPLITLTPPVLPYYYANQSTVPMRQHSMYFPTQSLPHNYNTYNAGAFSNNCLPYTGFMPSYTILSNNHHSSSKVQEKQPSPYKLKLKSTNNTLHQSKFSSFSNKATNSNEFRKPKDQEVTFDANSANIMRNAKSKDQLKSSGTSVTAFSFHSEDILKEKSPTIKCSRSSKKFLDYLCTPKGCRYFQSYIQKATPEVVDQILLKIGANFPRIMTDSYANYFFQKFIKLCNQGQRILILKHIKSTIFMIASNNSGTHALQEMFEQVISNEEITLLSCAISDDFIPICQVSLLKH